MILIINNRTAGTLSYLSGNVTIGPSGSVNVSTIYHFELSHDGQLRSDLMNGFAQLSDGTTLYSTLDALVYLDFLEGLKDYQGFGLSSTVIGSKQALDINIVGGSSDSGDISYNYNEISSVTGSALTTLLTYNSSGEEKLQKVDVSGTNIAEFTVVINSLTVDKKRTYFGGNLNGVFEFNNGINLQSGDVIEITVIHFRPSLGDFNARLQLIG